MGIWSKKRLVCFTKYRNPATKSGGRVVCYPAGGKRSKTRERKRTPSPINLYIGPSPAKKKRLAKMKKERQKLTNMLRALEETAPGKQPRKRRRKRRK